LTDNCSAAKARRKELIELIAAAADEIAAIDAEMQNSQKLALARKEEWNLCMVADASENSWMQLPE